MIQEKRDILVMFSYRNHKRGYIEMLFDRLSARSQQYPLRLYRGSLSDIHIYIKNNHLSIIDTLTNRDIASFDGVYFELWYKAQQQALAVAQYAKTHKVPFFSEELLKIMPMTKVGEVACLADKKIPLPDTFISSCRQIKKVFRKNPLFLYPLIVKAADGYGGKNNFLVDSYQDLLKILDSHKKTQFLIQEYIPNDHDYRCLVFGGEIKFVLKRSRDATSDSHLNNTSAGGKGEMVTLDTLSIPAQEAVLAAAKALNRDSFAGVDLMTHKETGQPYILEVNQTPQIEIGAEIEHKMDALLNYMEKITQ